MRKLKLVNGIRGIVVRFESNDSIVIRITLKNNTHKDILIGFESFSIKVGSRQV